MRPSPARPLLRDVGRTGRARSMAVPLTADALQQLQQQQDAELLYDEKASLQALVEQEASIARRAHVQQLLREYYQLQALSPDEAAGWQQRREASAARQIQMAWRRRFSRRTFLEVVHRTQLHRFAKAATTIQRAQRTRQHVVAEAAPPISREQLVALQREVVERTLTMAKELKEARAAQETWRAAHGSDEAVGEAAAGEAVSSSGTRRPPKPSLPVWLETPEWERQLEQHKPGGSAAVHELRAQARRGLHTAHPQREMLHAIRTWPELRAAMQAAAVRRQVARTQAAALHAQLSYPPPLPPAPPPNSSSSAAELAIPPILPSRSSVLSAHRRLLREERLKLDLEEQQAAAVMDEAGTASHQSAARAVLSSPRGADGAARLAAKLAHGTPLSPTAIERGQQTARGFAADATLSPAELYWLASLERPPPPPTLSAPAAAPEAIPTVRAR